MRIAMSEVDGKPLDCYLEGVKLDDERAGKIDVVLRGVRVLDDLCDRLSKRLDAFEESEKEGWWRDAR